MFLIFMLTIIASYYIIVVSCYRWTAKLFSHIFLYGLFIISCGFPFYKGNCTSGAGCARLCIRRGVCLHSGGADVGYGVRCGGYIHIVYECGACPGYLYQCLSIPYKTCPKSADCLRLQKPSAFQKNPAYQFQIHSGAVDVLFFGMRQTRREQFFPDSLQPPTVS